MMLLNKLMMLKYYLLGLLPFLPGLAFSQPDVSRLYQQIDSLQFLLYKTKDTLNKATQYAYEMQRRESEKFEFYSALARLENNKFTSKDSLLLKASFSVIDSGGRSFPATMLVIDGEVVELLTGSHRTSELLFTDFPKLQEQYKRGRLQVWSPYNQSNLLSSTMDLPSLPKTPAPVTAQAKKILAERLLFWIENACEICNCKNDVPAMLNDEKKQKMTIDKIIENRRQFFAFVDQNCKNRK